MKGPVNKPSSGKQFEMRRVECVLLTYKDVGLGKDKILSNAIAVAPPLYFGIVVSEEKYQNGTHHFHVFMLFGSPKTFNMKQLDSIGGTHGHYMPINKTPKRALAYVVKDGNYVFSMAQGGFEEYIQSAIDTWTTNPCHFDALVNNLVHNTKQQPVNYMTKPRSLQTPLNNKQVAHQMLLKAKPMRHPTPNGNVLVFKPKLPITLERQNATLSCPDLDVDFK